MTEECNMQRIELDRLSKDLRLSALKMAHDCGKNGSHIGSAFSSIEIYATLYGNILHYDSQNPYDENRDRLVVSKGHSVLALYSALRYAGFLSDEDIMSFETNGSQFHGHAMRNLEKGIEFSGGSLSMGMSFAVGVALSCKRKSQDSRVFCIIGDGECNEGLIWEAAMSAANFKLNNFTVIVDRNVLQYDGPTSSVMDLIDLNAKFQAFGFDVREVNGHDCIALCDALSEKYDKPLCVIANTVKGKGLSFAENKKEWHHHTISDEQYEQGIKEIENV